MATKTAKKKAPKAAPRVPTKGGARPKRTPSADGLTRAEIEKANAAGPGAVAELIRKGAAPKTAKEKAAPTPKGKAPAKATKTPTPPAAERDPRLPKPGTVLTRVFKNREVRVEVLDAGFRYDGKTWRSLSAIAREVSGTSWNGFLFFNLATRATKPAATPETK